MSEERTAMSTLDYLKTAECNLPREVVDGMVREPPSPFCSHQSVVLRTARVLCDHVEREHLGTVAVAPLDVVLDRERVLIVQPDVLFVSTARLSIIQEQVWGAPDLVVEVLSPGTEARDRHERRAWYRQYGVREYWLIDPQHEQILVIDFSGATPVESIAGSQDLVRSSLFPTLQLRPAALLV